MTITTALADWLLDADPALRWQVERDLLQEPAEVWRATRGQIAGSGFGYRLLQLQGQDGQWAGGSFFPAGFDFDGPEAANGAGQPWTATTWSLNTLRDWGLDAVELAGTAELLAVNSRWSYADLPYWHGEVDCCINGYTLANGAWLGADVSGIAEWFLSHSMPDGGWNCDWLDGASRSSFYSTLNALIGILYYESRVGGVPELAEARHAAEEYLLQRHLLNRLSTGQSVGPWAGQLAYPFRWKYSVLKALDYFRLAAEHDGAAPDPRLAEAVELLSGKRQSDGTWWQELRHPGRAWFEVDVPPGQPSKWLTLYSLRVLDWWDRRH